MSQSHAIGIVSAGVHIPETFMTAAEIERESGIPEEIVANRMGTRNKPIPGPDDHTSAMAVPASQDGLSQTDIRPDEIDLVLRTTEEWKGYHLWTTGVQTHSAGIQVLEWDRVGPVGSRPVFSCVFSRCGMVLVIQR